MSELYDARVTEAARQAAQQWKHFERTGEMPLRDVLRNACQLGAVERADQHLLENYLIELALDVLARGER